MTHRAATRSLPLVLFAGVVLASAQTMAAGGRRVYVDQGCAVCHGLYGHGGVGPRLAGDKFLAFPGYIIARITYGSAEVRGVGGDMPAFDNKISAEDVAHVATYIRQSWGNHFGKLSPKTVERERQKIEAEVANSSSGLKPAISHGNGVGDIGSGSISGPGSSSGDQ